MACDCCQERLEQLSVVLHEANAQILALLEEARKELAGLRVIGGSKCGKEDGSLVVGEPADVTVGCSREP